MGILYSDQEEVASGFQNDSERLCELEIQSISESDSSDISDQTDFTDTLSHSD